LFITIGRIDKLIFQALTLRGGISRRPPEYSLAGIIFLTLGIRDRYAKVVRLLSYFVAFIVVLMELGYALPQLYKPKILEVLNRELRQE